MKNLILITLMVLSGCASLKKLTQDENYLKLEEEKKKFYALVEFYKKNPMFERAIGGLDYATEGKAADYLWQQRLDRGTESPIEGVFNIAKEQEPMALILVQDTTASCKKSPLLCDFQTQAEKIYEPFKKCEQGDSKACAMKALELEESNLERSTYYAKKACILGNQGGCNMVTNHQNASDAAKSRALANQQMEYQRRKDAAAAFSNAFKSPTTCHSTRDFYGNVTTTCR